VVGLTLGAGGAYLLEYLDRTVKSTSDVERIFGLPVIGYISKALSEDGEAVSVAAEPESIVAESFRLLRSNIEFYRLSNPAQTIMITSPSRGTGKSMIASNLARSMAQEQGKVVLVDADLRRPAVHKYLKISRSPGLADVLRGRTDLSNALRASDGEGSPAVVTAGNIPSSTVELAGSRGIPLILAKLKQTYDVVVVDAPPLIIADSFNLASAVDALILVMEPGATPEEQAKAIKEQLGRANAKIVGIVFNKVSEASSDRYYDYRYRSMYAPKYYAGYTADATEEPEPRSRSKRLLDFFEHGVVPPEVSAKLEGARGAAKRLLESLRGRSGTPSSKDE
jgi:capsular exopolysaccharide synthesis family protein